MTDHTDHKKAVRVCDQYQCSHCGKQWDVGDTDVPECTVAQGSQVDENQFDAIEAGPRICMNCGKPLTADEIVYLENNCCECEGKIKCEICGELRDSGYYTTDISEDVFCDLCLVESESENNDDTFFHGVGELQVIICKECDKPLNSAELFYLKNKCWDCKNKTGCEPAEHHVDEIKIEVCIKHEYTQAIYGDGAAILKDGKRMTVEEILTDLRR